MATCKENCLYSPVCRFPFNTSDTKVEFADVCHHFKSKADIYANAVQGFNDFLISEMCIGRDDDRTEIYVCEEDVYDLEKEWLGDKYERKRNR